MVKNKKHENIREVKVMFNKPELFTQAVTHRSWQNENTEVVGNYERLEFLGDSVLQFVVSAYLYKKFPDKEEGYLTEFRANIVNTENLAKEARRLGVGAEMMMSKGEDAALGRENQSHLADILEAIIGAIYLDQGIAGAKSFILGNILHDVDEKQKMPLKSAISTLQEVVQAKGDPTPRYVVISEEGPDHDKLFEVEVYVGNKPLARGKGASKNSAKLAAAQAALVKVSAKS